MSITEKFPMSDQFNRIVQIHDLVKAGDDIQARAAICELDRIAADRGFGADYFKRLCADVLTILREGVSE